MTARDILDAVFLSAIGVALLYVSLTFY